MSKSYPKTCNNALLFPGKEIQSKLHVVQIFFDTATFDDIERDKKIKIEAQLSLIGGTIGLLTGFSVISGVEIIFYLVRLIWSSIKVVFKLITPLQAGRLLQDQES